MPVSVVHHVDQSRTVIETNDLGNTRIFVIESNGGIKEIGQEGSGLEHDEVVEMYSQEDDVGSLRELSVHAYGDTRMARDDAQAATNSADVGVSDSSSDSSDNVTDGLGDGSFDSTSGVPSDNHSVSPSGSPSDGPSNSGSDSGFDSNQDNSQDNSQDDNHDSSSNNSSHSSSSTSSSSSWGSDSHSSGSGVFDDF